MELLDTIIGRMTTSPSTTLPLALEPLLKLAAISHGYEQKPTFSDLSFSLAKGQRLLARPFRLRQDNGTALHSRI